MKCQAACFLVLGYSSIGSLRIIYVSCERIFNARLEGKPVIILSSNDGCAISRSAEAKALGLRMGEPWFKVKHQDRFKEVIALSSNFELYGEISARVMRMLARHSPRQEVYSIDECFLDLAHIPADELLPYAQALRAEVLQWVGIPVAVGLAPTKTLAKLAAERAKKEGVHARVLTNVLDDEAGGMAAVDVWGVGPASARKLQDQGIKTVADLARLPLPTAQKLGGATLSRTVAEVQGRACIAFNADKRDPKQVMSSRSFGRPVIELGTLNAAVREFADKCLSRMAKRQVAAKSVFVYLVARLPDGSRSTLSKGHQFTRHVDDPQLLRAVCLKLTAELYRKQLSYVKAGVLLLDLQTTTVAQGSLFDDVSIDVHAQLDATAQKVNELGGDLDAESLGVSQRLLAIAGVQPGSALLEDWKPRAERRTPAFTSSWDELPVVKTG